ncbi:MAG: hypothetical protein GWN18_18670, partial [Thermoplasmata archaeon]|nr:hypothetical protein [Thermoplasmata archaeon]NIS14153.1 hypothetical protein [Thermoplasmata archaeon]NIV80719.1 hypothetical protein [Thermoplasmata archaeon]NIW84534.1 hypothetical protein [Thermoplasmata archaeon]NIW90850.1 hypothetical protein [Thermoplasmata archaeon]
DMRANSWLRGILALIGGLIVLGAFYGTYSWTRRRRRAKEEKDRIVVRRRFPSGPKALWPMSKVMWDEDL